VTEPVVAIGDSATENIKQPSGVMLDAEGNYVIARPDKASWARYQAKAKVSAEAQKEIALGSKELQERGLECPIDQRLFSDPTKTPCCQKTYCNECITNALLDDDLQCPGCKSEGILIDDLVPDLDMVERIRSYEEARSTAKKEQEQQKEKESTPQTNGERDKNSPVADNESPKERNTSKSPSPTAKSPSSQTSSTSSSKKRKADSELENDRTAQGPVEKPSSTTTATTSPASTSTISKPTTTKPTTKPQLPPELAFLDNPAFTSSMAMPGMNAFMGMPMGMGMPMMMNPYMMNPMMPMMPNMYNMPGMPMQNPAMNGVNGMANIYGGLNMMPNGMPNGNNFGAMNGQIPMTNGYNNTNNNNTNFNGVPSGPRNFQNQQRNGFANNRANGNAEDSAYFRQPVNPHRHQGRRNVPRPTDYREI
jgi:protein MPE1